jgi:trigger factor
VNVTHQITKLERSSVKLSVTVSKDDVVSSYNALLSKHLKSVQIPGFRKGHVPASVLERKFGQEIKNEALSETVEAALQDVFERIEEKPYAYSQPKLDKMPEADFSKDAQFEVTYDVFPRVKVADFSGIAVKKPRVEISDADVQKELDAIRERNAIIVDKKADEAAAVGDLVTCAWKELDEAGNPVDGSEKNDQVFAAGNKTHYFDLGPDVVGMKTGETKEIAKTYGGDYHIKELAGTSKKFSLSVSAVKVKNLPEIDDELAQDVNEKFKTLADLKADIVKRLETTKDRKIEALAVRAVIDELVARNPFEVPDSMVRAEFALRMRNMAMQLGMEPKDAEKFLRQPDDESLEEFRPTAEKQLKSNIIVAGIIKDKNITVSDEDIEAEYGKIAEETGADAGDVRKHYDDRDAKEYLIEELKEKKLFAELLSQAAVQEGDTMTYEELMNHD